MINVIIADDQTLLCESFGFILSSYADINVIGYANDGLQLLQLLETTTADIILMDIEMPNLGGVEATKIVKEKYPDTKIIILTTFENADSIMESFIVGADGYIVKDIGHEDLALSIKATYNGLCIIHQSVKNIMVSRFKILSEFKEKYRDRLSDKDIEIIKHVASGKSNKEIAACLNYSEGTIKNKISKLLETLEVDDRIQLAIFAIENGLV